MFATKEAVLIKEHHPEAEVYVLYNELKAFGKGFNEFVTRAKNEYGVKYLRGRPSELMENPTTKNLKIKYEDTTRRLVEFLEVDMAILCPALIPSEKNRQLAEALGIEVDEFGFFKVRDPLLAPVDTSVDGIFLCGYSQSPKDIPEAVAQASGAAARAAETIALTSRSKVKIFERIWHPRDSSDRRFRLSMWHQHWRSGQRSGSRRIRQEAARSRLCRREHVHLLSRRNK